jgi:hypothetical protein
MVEDVRKNGTDVTQALDLALASMALDCLEAVMPAGTASDNYLVMRTMKVVGAIEGGSWAPLSRLETDVALCLSSLMRSPASWRTGDWDARISSALLPYLDAVGLNN